jgi:erythromycin esterase
LKDNGMNKKKTLFVVGVLLLVLVMAGAWHAERIHIAWIVWRAGPAPELTAADRAEIGAWLRENTIQLDTIEAGSGFEDLQPLKAVIGDAPIVSLGEAAHLNGSFYRAKHRIIEFLIEEMDFRVVAFEAPFAGSLQLNDYLQTGEGEPERALAAMVYTAWNTEEVLALVKWLRQYNATHEKTVKFYGFDNKPASDSAKAVYDYFRQTDGTTDYDELLRTLMNPWTAYHVYADDGRSRPLVERIEELIDTLQSRVPVPASGSTPAEQIRRHKQWQLAIRHAVVMLQHAGFRAMHISEASRQRDKDMADNAQWIMDHEGGAKTILWAANAHISTGPGGGAMGSHLRRVYGDDMVVMGLLSNRKFAYDPNEAGTTESQGSNSAQAILAGAGLERAILDLRSLPGGIVSQTFGARLPIDGGNWTILPVVYDAILFIESTVNAQTLVPIQWAASERLVAPSNLDFEQLAGGKPVDWDHRSGQGIVEYEIAGSHEAPYEGETCGMIRRRPGRAFGQVLMNLHQSLKPNDVRGQKMRFAAAARVDGGHAYLRLSIDVRGGQDIFQYTEVTSENWQQYRLDAEIPPEATKITYGLSYLGHGTACIDDVSIRPVH